MRVKMYRQFKSYNIRCNICGKGKPKTEFEGSWRVCNDCKKEKTKSCFKKD